MRLSIEFELIFMKVALLCAIGFLIGDSDAQFNHCLLPKHRLFEIIHKHFKIDKELGAGYFGVVYRAHDLQDKKVVALKLFKNRQRKNCFQTWGQLGLDMRFKEADLPQMIWDKATTHQKDYFVPIYKDMGKSKWEPAVLTMELLEKSKHETVVPNLNDRSNTLLSIYTTVQSLHAYSALLAPPTPVVHRDFHFGNFQYRTKDWRLKLYDFSIASICSRQGCAAKDIRRLGAWLLISSLLGGGSNDIHEFITEWENQSVEQCSAEGCTGDADFDAILRKLVTGEATEAEVTAIQKGPKKKKRAGPKVNFETEGQGNPLAPDALMKGVKESSSRKAPAPRSTRTQGRTQTKTSSFGTRSGTSADARKVADQLEDTLLMLVNRPEVLNSFPLFLRMVMEIVEGTFDLGFLFRHMREDELIAIRARQQDFPFIFEEWNGKKRKFEEGFEVTKYKSTGQVSRIPIAALASRDVQNRRGVRKGGMVDENGQLWMPGDRSGSELPTEFKGFEFVERDMFKVIHRLAGKVTDRLDQPTPFRVAPMDFVDPASPFHAKLVEELSFVWEVLRLAVQVEMLGYPMMAARLSGHDGRLPLPAANWETVPIPSHPSILHGFSEVGSTHSETSAPAWVQARVEALNKSPVMTAREFDEMEDNEESTIHQRILRSEQCSAFPCSVRDGCDPPHLMPHIANPTGERRFASLEQMGPYKWLNQKYLGLDWSPVLTFKGLTMGMSDLPIDFEFYERMRVSDAIGHGTSRLLRPHPAWDESPQTSAFKGRREWVDEDGEIAFEEFNVPLSENDPEYRFAAMWDPEWDAGLEMMLYQDVKTSLTEVGVSGLALLQGGMDVVRGEVPFPLDANLEYLPDAPLQSLTTAAEEDLNFKYAGGEEPLPAAVSEEDKRLAEEKHQVSQSRNAKKRKQKVPDWMALAREQQSSKLNMGRDLDSVSLRRLFAQRTSALEEGLQVDRAAREFGEDNLGGQVARRARRLIMCHPYVRTVRGLVSRWLERPEKKLMALPGLDSIPSGSCDAFEIGERAADHLLPSLLRA